MRRRHELLRRLFEGDGSNLWLLIAATLALRLPIFFFPPFLKDEASYSALAVKILNGALPYAGAVDHKPPGIALTYAAVYWLAGWYRLFAVHVLFLGVVTVTGVILGECAGMLTGSPRTRLAGLLYVVASATGLPGDVQAANTELFLNLPLAAAAWFLIGRADGGSRVRELGALFAAGLLTGVAGLFKYQAAAAVLAWAYAVVAAGGGWRRLASGLGALASGGLTVVLALFGFFWLRGAWSAFWFWGWRYNLEFAGLLDWWTMAGNGVFYTTVAALFWLPLVVCAFVVRAERPRLAVAWFAAMVPAVAAGGRFFPHYYLMALPPFCLLAAPGAVRLFDDRAHRRRLVLALSALSALAIAVTATLSWSWYRIRPALALDHRQYVAVGTYVKGHSFSGQRVFVWGNSPEIYLYSERLMGTRFAFCNYHTGKIWGTAEADTQTIETDRLVVPRAWDELLEDLNHTPPAFIVDAAAGGLDDFGLNPASRYPDLWEIVQRDYQVEAIVNHVPIYRLKPNF